MRVTLTLPAEMDQEMAAFAERGKIGKTEAMRRAITLLKISNDEHKKGRGLGIVIDEGNELTAIGKLLGV